MSKKSRLFAVIVALALIFAMLFSACLIITEANHDCSGDDCQICHQISICISTFKSLAYSCLIVLILAVFAKYSSIAMQLFSKKTSVCTTLVSLKVKLSD